MQSISSTVSSIWDNIRSAVSDKISGIQSTIQSGFEAAVGYIRGLASDAWNWGRDTACIGFPERCCPTVPVER